MPRGPRRRERTPASEPRTSSLAALEERLSTVERALIQPILDARSEALSDAEVEMTVEHRGATWVCAIAPRQRDCCPFQFVFCDPGEGRITFWFFIGPSTSPGPTEVFGDETIASRDEIQLVARGVDEFLRSEVFRERWILGSGQPVRQVLHPSRFPGDRAAPLGPGCLRSRRGGRLETQTYEPWLT